MTYVEQMEKEREENLKELDGELVAWTVPNRLDRPLCAIVKDKDGVFKSKEHSPFPCSYSKPKWHDLYPFVVRKENVRATMQQFAFAGYDNAVAEIHWMKKGY